MQNTEFQKIAKNSSLEVDFSGCDVRERCFNTWVDVLKRFLFYSSCRWWNETEEERRSGGVGRRRSERKGEGGGWGSKVHRLTGLEVFSAWVTQWHLRKFELLLSSMDSNLNTLSCPYYLYQVWTVTWWKIYCPNCLLCLYRTGSWESVFSSSNTYLWYLFEDITLFSLYY